MRNNIISRRALLEYLKKEQIAFQFIDGLIVFTQPETNKYDEEYQEQEVKDMNYYIENSLSLKIVKPDDVIDSKSHHTGFSDFARWTLDRDLLILVDDVLLLCLPNYNNYKEIFEKVA